MGRKQMTTVPLFHRNGKNKLRAGKCNKDHKRGRKKQKLFV
jgi:hypothetical protein